MEVIDLLTIIILATWCIIQEYRISGMQKQKRLMQTKLNIAFQLLETVRKGQQSEKKPL